MDREFLMSLGLDDSAVTQILEQNSRDLLQAESDLAGARSLLAQRDYSDALRDALHEKNLKFTSKAAERDFMAQLKELKLELKDGGFAGLDDFIQKQKSADPSAFAPEHPAPHFLAPAGLGTAPPSPSLPPNVAQAREMGAQRAAARKASSDILKFFL